MNHIFIEPLDVWLFRDGRPFAAGSDHRAESLFPPFPTTTLGAIRRRELVRNNFDFSESDRDKSKEKAKKYVGEPVRMDAPNNLNGLTLRGPFVTRRENGSYVRYHPQPADACKQAGELLPMAKPSRFKSGVQAGTPSGRFLPLGLGMDYEKEGEPLWLSEPALKDYLKGQPVNGVEANDLFMREDRIGIGMDNATYTVTNGALYEVQFIRPRKDVGLSMVMDGYDWASVPEGWLQLGGESRAAMYQTIGTDKIDNWPTQAKQLLPARFKVYFATPAYFSGGWQPKTGSWKDFFGDGVDLVSAAIGRYTNIGGFDLAEAPGSAGAHRPTRRFVPAGSVYYFENKSNSASLLKDSLTEFGGEFGLGQILIEEW